nr:MAG TPA: hypothetical protein [Caudoviricetes sp.]
MIIKVRPTSPTRPTRFCGLYKRENVKQTN